MAQENKPKKQPAQFTRAWYLQKLAKHCDHYCADVKMLEIFALKWFLQALESQPIIDFSGGKIVLEETKTYEIEDGDWWKEGHWPDSRSFGRN